MPIRSHKCFLRKSRNYIQKRYWIFIISLRAGTVTFVFLQCFTHRKCSRNVYKINFLKKKCLWNYVSYLTFLSLVCDFLGEKIASVLGISTPKYQYAIDEYYRMKKEVCLPFTFSWSGLVCYGLDGLWIEHMYSLGAQKVTPLCARHFILESVFYQISIHFGIF